MRWPLVSRGTLDAVVSERDRLRTQNDALLAHLTTVDRVEHGLTETPRNPKPSDPMPPSLRTKIGRFGSQMTITDQMARATRARSGGKSWQEIEAEFDASVNG